MALGIAWEYVDTKYRTLVPREPLIDILLAAGLTRARLCLSPWQTVDCGERRFDSGPGDQG